MAATKMFFRSGFGYAGFSDLGLDMQVFQIWVWICRSHLNVFGYAGFSDLEDFWDDLPVSRLKYNALDDFHEVFQEAVWTSWKSSDEVSLS
uniref:Uncharacterized protein n=1 Tax=Brassica oleracea var. oleracea TaxID=109376 RepID=A0A0D3ANC6_BRAOL